MMIGGVIAALRLPRSRAEVRHKGFYRGEFGELLVLGGRFDGTMLDTPGSTSPVHKLVGTEKEQEPGG